MLGKKPYRYDKRTLQFGKYLTTEVLPTPPALHWGNPNPLGTLFNDTIGDCTIAGPCHQEMVWRDINGVMFFPTDADALAAYEAVGGYNPNATPDANGNNPTDQGCVLLDVLNYWKQTGIAGRKIGAFVQVNQLNIDHIRQAAYLFGGLIVGINMPVSAKNQPTLWDTPPEGLTGDGTPGSWGGHCIYMPGYDQNVMETITWGERIAMTISFWQNYIDEVYAFTGTKASSVPDASSTLALLGAGMTALACVARRFRK